MDFSVSHGPEARTTRASCTGTNAAREARKHCRRVVAPVLACLLLSGNLQGDRTAHKNARRFGLERFRVEEPPPGLPMKAHTRFLS